MAITPPHGMLARSIRTTRFEARLAVDLQAVTFIDSGGLSALVQLNNTAQATSRRFELPHVPPVVERVLAISGLDKVFGRSRTAKVA